MLSRSALVLRTTLSALCALLLAAGCSFNGAGIEGLTQSDQGPRPDAPEKPDLRADTSADAPGEDGPAIDGPRPDLPPLDQGADKSPPAPDTAPDQTAPLDFGPCPSVCDRCVGGYCEITCPQNGDCVCPPGIPCRPFCGIAGCKDRVDCSQATDCDINCADGGWDACHGDVLCGTGSCKVRCGANSCRKKVDCSRSTSCDVDCTSITGRGCQGDVLCGSGTCKVRCATDSCRGKIDGSSATDCDFVCAGTAQWDACHGDISCGSGSCKVACGINSCRKKITASSSTTVTVNCETNACHGDIACGSGQCTVDCLRAGACRSAIDCQSSCGCAVSCLPNTTCQQNRSCPAKCGGCSPLDFCVC